MEIPMNKIKHIKYSNDITYIDLDDRICIIPSVTNGNEKAYMVTDTTGIFIMRQIRKGAEVTELVKKISEKFGVNERSVYADISNFIDVLTKERIINVYSKEDSTK